MAQVALDLSDPTDHGPQSLVDTDELLSQLAGEEIDRLLAEADLTTPTRPPAIAPGDADLSAKPPSPAEIDKPPTAQSLAANPSPAQSAASAAERLEKSLTLDQARSIDLPRSIESAPELAAMVIDSPRASEPKEQDSLSIGTEIDQLLAGLPTDPNPAATEDAEPKTASPSVQSQPIDSFPTPQAVHEAASRGAEIDQLLASLATDPDPEKAEEPAAAARSASASEADSFAVGEERNAVLDAAGFESSADQPLSVEAALRSDPVHEMEPVGEERTALLAAAGFDAHAGSGAPAAMPQALHAPLHGPGPVSKTEAHAGPGSPGATVQATSVSEDELASLPIYFRPLEWINAPLDHRSPVVRKMLGYVAILTLFNAIAILVYSLFIRKN